LLDAADELQPYVWANALHDTYPVHEHGKTLE